MSMWQVFGTSKSSYIPCMPGDYNIMGSMVFVSFYGKYFYNNIWNPYTGGTYSAGILTDPALYVPAPHNNVVHSSYCFDINIPLGCSGLLGVTLEIQNPLDAVCDNNHQGSHPYFLLNDALICPVDPTPGLYLQDGYGSDPGRLSVANSPFILLGYFPATIVPTGSTTKRLEIGFLNDYRVADVTYKLDNVFWRNV